MFISGLGTATPARRYTQRECWEAFQSSEVLSRLEPRARSILKKVLGARNGIETRYLALDTLSEAFELSPDVLHERFALHAPALASQSALRALAEGGVCARDIDALLVSTCTGYLCPGLTSYVSEQLGLRPDALLLDLVGQGCGAALPNLSTAESLIAGGRCANVLSVCVEVCSAAFYLDDDPGVLISACLFGDGAGAALLTRELRPGRRRVRWREGGTNLSAAERNLLRFEQRGGMLRNILRPEVPALAAQHAGTVLEATLGRAGVSRKQINGWIMHAGGRDVLAAVGERLGLSGEDTRRSASVLREFGNVSSPFVFFVLERALREGAPGGCWWMASFGAGFSSHGVLLEVD